MFKDMDKLVFGIFIMVLYVQFIISKFNCVENRVSVLIIDFYRFFTHTRVVCRYY